MKWLDKMFDDHLRYIISKGDTAKDYRNLFKRIVEIHREEFTEENIPAAKSYLRELLQDAFTAAEDREDAQYKISCLEREISEIRTRLN